MRLKQRSKKHKVTRTPKGAKEFTRTQLATLLKKGTLLRNQVRKDLTPMLTLGEDDLNLRLQ